MIRAVLIALVLSLPSAALGDDLPGSYWGLMDTGPGGTATGDIDTAGYGVCAYAPTTDVAPNDLVIHSAACYAQGTQTASNLVLAGGDDEMTITVDTAGGAEVGVTVTQTCRGAALAALTEGVDFACSGLSDAACAANLAVAVAAQSGTCVTATSAVAVAYPQPIDCEAYAVSFASANGVGGGTAFVVDNGTDGIVMLPEFVVVDGVALEGGTPGYLRVRNLGDSAFYSLQALNIIGSGLVRSGAGNSHEWSTRSEMYASADGYWSITDNATTGFTRATFGPETNQYPAIYPDGAAGATIAGGAAVTDPLNVNFTGYLGRSTTAAITASTTQTQGNGALTTEVNEVSVVANPLDTVTLPAAAAGRFAAIINDGANVLQIFPAAGDDASGGVDAAIQLVAGKTLDLLAYDATTWSVAATTEVAHGEMTDSQNTDAYAITVQTNVHCYHSNGLAAGDLAGWTFDAGGAGTSHAITGVVDGGSGEIAVITGDDHLLSVGDIVSQVNLTDAAYEGVFVVNTINSAVIYEVTAVYTATDTGTMDQCAAIIAGNGSAGKYLLGYWASGAAVGANETFDFVVYVDAAAQAKTEVRRKFGAGGDSGSWSGGGVLTIAAGASVVLTVANTSSAADIIIRNINLVPTRL